MSRSRAAADQDDSKFHEKEEANSSFASTRHANEMAVILGLSISPEWEEGVATNLRMLEIAAEQVLSFDLPDDIEPAVVFQAI